MAIDSKQMDFNWHPTMIEAFVVKMCGNKNGLLLFIFDHTDIDISHLGPTYYMVDRCKNEVYIIVSEKLQTVLLVT